MRTGPYTRRLTFGTDRHGRPPPPAPTSSTASTASTAANGVLWCREYGRQLLVRRGILRRRRTMARRIPRRRRPFLLAFHPQRLTTHDFDLVYSLHSFAATVEGQASVVKGDSLVLMDDSNSYQWWLVQEIRYIPANSENIETQFERLARLNKYRNVDVSVTKIVCFFVLGVGFWVLSGAGVRESLQICPSPI